MRVRQVDGPDISIADPTRNDSHVVGWDNHGSGFDFIRIAIGEWGMGRTDSFRGGGVDVSSYARYAWEYDRIETLSTASPREGRQDIAGCYNPLGT